MVYIETNSTTGSENLAYEEYFLKRTDIKEPLVMLWRNRPTIVVGAFQNTIAEINEEFVREQGIAVVRRTSGGGAVYHDLGNLCFSFIMEFEDFVNTDYSIFLYPVAEALAGLGIPVEINGRNDLTLDGNKISGSATRIYKNRVLFHGTLLYNSDLSILSQALQVKPDKLAAKGIPSVRARVTTICPHLKNKISVLEFKERLLQALFKGDQIRSYVCKEEEQKEILLLAKEKYEAFDWTYGKNPSADMVCGRRFTGGEVTVRLGVKHSRIQSIQFEGDFLGCMDVKEVEQKLTGCIYDKKSVANVLDKIDIIPYFGNITRAEVTACIMGEESETVSEIS